MSGTVHTTVQYTPTPDWLGAIPKCLYPVQRTLGTTTIYGCKTISGCLWSKIYENYCFVNLEFGTVQNFSIPTFQHYLDAVLWPSKRLWLKVTRSPIGTSVEDCHKTKKKLSNFYHTFLCLLRHADSKTAFLFFHSWPRFGDCRKCGPPPPLNNKGPPYGEICGIFSDHCFW